MRQLRRCPTRFCQSQLIHLCWLELLIGVLLPFSRSRALVSGLSSRSCALLFRFPSRSLASALSPAHLRVGGTKADTVFYDMSDQPSPTPPPPFEHVMNATQWLMLLDFTKAVGFDLIFGLNNGPGPRKGRNHFVDLARVLRGVFLFLVCVSCLLLRVFCCCWSRSLLERR